MSRSNLKLLILFFAILISIVSIGLVVYGKSQPPPPQKSDVTVQSSRQEKYMIKDYQGMVAVYYTAQPDTPKYVTEVSVKTLPLADRQHLQSGIYAANDAALTSILEDYQ